MHFDKPVTDRIPILAIDFNIQDEISRHDNLISLVDLMIDLHNQFREARTSHEKTLIRRQIDATDKEIDKLVYKLYGLTDKEIKIVEQSK